MNPAACEIMSSPQNISWLQSMIVITSSLEKVWYNNYYDCDYKKNVIDYNHNQPQPCYIYIYMYMYMYIYG